MSKAPRQTSKQDRAKKRIAGEESIEKQLKVEETALAGATGIVKKDSVYCKKLEAVIESNRKHPKHHNIQMQAHHIISEKAITLAGKEYIDELLLLGYNINDLENLAFIPSTLQGACHLGVQPHIGNHSAKILPENRDAESRSYDDDDHPRTYHEMVKLRLMETLKKLQKLCPSTHPEAPARAKKKLHELSAKILRLISDSPSSAPLTNAYKAFENESAIGCGGQNSITKKIFLSGNIVSCPVHRNHLNNRQGAKQQPEGITYPAGERYQLAQGG